MRFQRHVFVLAACLLLFALSGLAQESRGSIVGRVTDSTGAVVPGVHVKATNQATNVSATAVTNADGNYQIRFLNPGMYAVDVSLTGFKTFERRNIELRINDRLGLDVVLEVGDVSEKMAVTAETPLLEVASANVGQVIDTRRITELPIPHGSVRSLFFLLGGVTLAGGGYSTAEKFQDPSRPASSSWLTINGSPVGTTEFSLDGVPNTQTANSDFGSGMSNQPPADAIQELKLETAYDASVGHTSGTHINMIIKSGTNQFHGTAYLFYRNPVLNANSFFGNSSKQARADFGYQRPGASLSGPVVIPKLYNGKDRTFFTYAYEFMNDKTQGYPVVGTVPTADERNGDFSALLKIGAQYQIYDPMTTAVAPNGRYSRQPLANNVIPASRLDPIALKIANYWPVSNIPGLADGSNNFTTQNNPDPNYYHNHIVRIDHTLTEKQRLYFRFSRYFKDEGPYRDYFQNPASGRYFVGKPYNFAIDDTYMISPRLVLDVRYGYQRFPSASWSQSKGFDLTSLGFSSAVANQLGYGQDISRTFPGVNVSGMTGLQTEGGAQRTGDDIHSWFADVSRPFSNHMLKFGGDFRVYRKNVYDFGNATPRYTFATSFTNGPLDNSASSPNGIGQALAAYYLGIPSSGTIDRNDSYSVQSTYGGLYVQDDWRITSRLTVTLGLRYEYEGPLTERYNRTVRGFDPAAQLTIASQVMANYAANPSALLPASAFRVAGGLTYTGQGGQPREVFDGTGNFMPRFGFSWNPKKDTVLRGGYGVYFLDTGVTSRFGPYILGYNQTTSMTPSLDGGITYRSTLSNPYPDGILAAVGSRNGVNTYLGQAISFFDTGLKPPYMQRWNLNVQHMLPGKFLLETGYAGSRGTRLRISKNVDGLPLQYLSKLPYRDQATIDSLSRATPNPFYPLLSGTSLAAMNLGTSQLLLPYPQFTSMTTTTSQGYSWYHGWQSRIERRFAQGFMLQLSYTFSKLMDAITYLNAADPVPYRSISANDRPHHIGLMAIYELPFGKGRALFGSAPRAVNQVVGGWQLSAMYNLWSGSPISFGDVILTGDIKDIPLSSGERRVARWFNTSVFERTSAKQLGSHLFQGPLYYSGVRSDGVNMWDLSLLKSVKLGERFQLQVRAEALNALNHANFTAPNTTVTSSAFATVTGESTLPRILQFGFKVLF